jgi:hypothetical protein
MAVVHNTTMNPTKRALVAAWLPGQPWYADTGQAPDLVRVGGFRLDDPEGEVGIEFVAVTDQSGDGATTYHVPMTYRASAIDELASALIGTSEHGVLGLRWIYDGAADPVLVAQLVALMQGDIQAQAQSVSNTPDPTVESTPVSRAGLSVSGLSVSGLPVSSLPVSGLPELAGNVSGTEVVLPAVAADDGLGDLVVRITRRLSPVASTAGPGEGHGGVSANWQLPDGTLTRGMFAGAWIR